MPVESSIITTALQNDAVMGLSCDPKYLLSKYFYDSRGSDLFREIMQMPEYYLTGCELEIFRNQKKIITEALVNNTERFDLVELGSGDGLKTRILLEEIIKSGAEFRYVPVDISSEANRELVDSLAVNFPDLPVDPFTGDFFRLTEKLNGSVSQKKVILFLGSNIGNFNDHETNDFLTFLADICSTGDRVLIGFDLKKSPGVIMDAYNDSHGHTARFNLNHLERLNRELEADFQIDKFEHHTTYNPLGGEVRSYLVSTDQQEVTFKCSGDRFRFSKWEPILMERSRKFDLSKIKTLANDHGFNVIRSFTDSKGWFVDSLWEKQ
ncbi:MAG: L-histidine N(alpha)-methyltransferase [Bacteroidales bacterium]|nr:L-histidine N(alpha)-methyltransferase [Bacteroidales bacterium]